MSDGGWWVMQAKALILAHPQAIVGELADLAGMSPLEFNRRFYLATGFRVLEWREAQQRKTLGRPAVVLFPATTPTPNTHVIYFFEIEGGFWYVGRTNNLKQRWASHKLRFGTSVVLQVLASVRTNNIREVVRVEMDILGAYLSERSIQRCLCRQLPPPPPSP